MHLHILGIAGTFMSALAILAREAGHKVTGCDANCYPPVSTLLSAQGIEWTEGYGDIDTALKADLVIIGNAIKRGMPVLEAVLNAKQKYISGPQWLFENILSQKKVIAVAGTHGKTTTTSMLAHILDFAGLNPSFLIGGVATNFNTSARLTNSDYFVIEADEYDSAFFDKRPKLMHYRPEIAILNNLEFDHADIYADLDAIKQQFHYYLKTIPATGIVIKPKQDVALNEVIERGLFCKLDELAIDTAANWQAKLLEPSGEAFQVIHENQVKAEVRWPLIGQFNVENGLAAIAASYHAGVDIEKAAKALALFKPVKRRLELRGKVRGISVYDDFAHHPTAIQKTLNALKESKRHQRIFVVLEFASYTMKTGVHANSMAEALAKADKAYVLNPSEFDLQSQLNHWQCPYAIYPNTDQIVAALGQDLKENDAVLIMSNRGFANIHQTLLNLLETIT